MFSLSGWRGRAVSIGSRLPHNMCVFDLIIVLVPVRENLNVQNGHHKRVSQISGRTNLVKATQDSHIAIGSPISVMIVCDD
jgi:hypothetical protein